MGKIRPHQGKVHWYLYKIPVEIPDKTGYNVSNLEK